MKAPKDPAREPAERSVDDDLEAFFQAQRQSDLRHAPSFESMTSSSVAPSAGRPGRARVVIAASLIAAAASLALMVTQRTQSDSTDSRRIVASPDAVSTEANSDATYSVDDLCNAVLAALDEHEQDAAMQTPTDTLLLPGE